MRLLHTKHLTFEDFFDSQIPQYAILSHRWGAKEVSYKEMRKGGPRAGQSLQKIQACCRLAASRGKRWVWIDTCCIDKRSSAELSEAINSMWRWYERADECYAYLADVVSFADEGGAQGRWAGGDVSSSTDIDKEPSVDFQGSVWFTRGWTLQELLAPAKVIFFDRRWKELGDKRSLSHACSAATGIRPQMMSLDTGTLRSRTSVAMKMSWISRRHTSRAEDMAYCLLGLFGINMPLLYGEGERAFMRLQLEIIRHHGDDSVFAWTTDNPSGSYGLLARSPRDFALCGDIERLPLSSPERKPWSMTNLGLKLHVPSTASWWEQTPGEEDRRYLVLELDCCEFGARRIFNRITIRLREIRNVGWQRLPDSALHFTYKDEPLHKTYKIYVPQPGVSQGYFQLTDTLD